MKALDDGHEISDLEGMVIDHSPHDVLDMKNSNHALQDMVKQVRTGRNYEITRKADIANIEKWQLWFFRKFRTAIQLSIRLCYIIEY